MIRLVSAITSLVLVGCSAVPIPLTHLQTSRSTIGASGGAFSATYSGRFASSLCSPGQNGTFSFGGAGYGNFIGSSSESGSLTRPSKSGRCRFLWKGSATLTSALHPRNTITSSLLERTGYSPCAIPPNFAVTGGTGRFANATGSGKVVFTCHLDGTYTDQWSGTITF